MLIRQIISKQNLKYHTDRQYQRALSHLNFPAHFLKVIDIGLGNLTTVHLTTYTLGGKHAGTRWLS